MIGRTRKIRGNRRAIQPPAPFSFYPYRSLRREWDGSKTKFLLSIEATACKYFGDSSWLLNRQKVRKNNIFLAFVPPKSYFITFHEAENRFFSYGYLIIIRSIFR